MRAPGHRRSLLTWLTPLLVLGCSEGAAPPGDGSAADRPHVLLISIDSLRADHLRCYGYDKQTSPVMDRLAAEGVLFEQVIASSSWTLPSHVALMTGVPDPVHGVRRSAHSLGQEAETLAERFGRAGYDTAGFFSGPYLHPHFGFGQGFDTYVDCQAFDLTDPEDRERAEAGGLEGQPASTASHLDITGPRLVAAVTEALEQRERAGSDAPLFLFVHMWDVHYDYLPPPPYDTRFTEPYDGPVTGTGLGQLSLAKTRLRGADLEHLLGLYDGEIAWTDHHVGLILEQLEAHGLRDDTLVAVTSDHGEEFFEHGEYGHRKTLLEESVRVPLILSGAGAVPEGARVAGLVGLVDVAPTLLDLAGVEPLPLAVGTSLRATWSGGARAETALPVLSELASQQASVTALRGPGWKLVVDKKSKQPVALYDLTSDPGEQINLVGQRTDLEAESLRTLQRTLDVLQAQRKLFREGASADATLPEDIERQLQAIGYMDMEPADDDG
jgi:arylsulfatase A-like enzyme